MFVPAEWPRRLCHDHDGLIRHLISGRRRGQGGAGLLTCFLPTSHMRLSCNTAEHLLHMCVCVHNTTDFAGGKVGGFGPHCWHELSTTITPLQGNQHVHNLNAAFHKYRQKGEGGVGKLLLDDRADMWWSPLGEHLLLVGTAPAQQVPCRASYILQPASVIEADASGKRGNLLCPAPAQGL